MWRKLNQSLPGVKESGTEKQPKRKVFVRDFPGTSGIQTSGYPGRWVGTSRIWKSFMQDNFGLIFRSLKEDNPEGPNLEKKTISEILA